MADRNSLLKIASKLKTQIRIDGQYLQWAKEHVPRMFSAEEKKKRHKEVHQNRKKLARVMARINKMSVGGGRTAAAIDSGRGGVAKSLMTRKLTPKT